MKTLHLGFEVGTGKPVAIPLRHLAVTGQTQEAGKTTTLEGLVARGAADGLRAVAFITKRGERSFKRGSAIFPYFKERADWQFVASILEATMRERLKFERPWIIKASKGAKTLADVQKNVAAALPKAKGLSESVYTTLAAYLAIVVPQIEQLPYTDTLKLSGGLNIMNLGGYTSELQALVIRSVMEWVYQREEHTVVIVPEAWEFIPQKRGSPVLLAAEELIRKGAGLGNYMWLDSQDLAGVNVAIRKSVIVWLLGVQREENEVRRTLAYITDAPKPKVDDVMQLGKGEFYACYGREVKHTYVQPAWMQYDEAKSIAVALRTDPRRAEEAMSVIGAASVSARGVRATSAAHPAASGAVERRGPYDADEEDEMDRQERERYEKRITSLESQVGTLQHELDVEKRARQMEAILTRKYTWAGEALTKLREILLGDTAAASGNGQAVDIETVVQQVLARIPSSGAVYQVAPVEKLRKVYQEAEVGRILEAVSKFNGIQKDVLALLEMSDGIISQQKIAARLGKGPGGWLAQHLEPMKEAGFIDVIERQGARKRLRTKISEDLAHYQATEDEIEACYQQVMAASAGVSRKIEVLP